MSSTTLPAGSKYSLQVVYRAACYQACIAVPAPSGDSNTVDATSEYRLPERSLWRPVMFVRLLLPSGNSLPSLYIA